ncbi:hypothetical protein TWF694_011433 [Orbilia ellipsospora]|uniref:Uncharacterized protein n=1 Tax=Orbilia ellipsospora TaxID=2528407 RepID=A0AAV9X6G1_9PEZI
MWSAVSKVKRRAFFTPRLVADFQKNSTYRRGDKLPTQPFKSIEYLGSWARREKYFDTENGHFANQGIKLFLSDEIWTFEKRDTNPKSSLAEQHVGLPNFRHFIAQHAPPNWNVSAFQDPRLQFTKAQRIQLGLGVLAEFSSAHRHYLVDNEYWVTLQFTDFDYNFATVSTTLGPGQTREHGFQKVAGFLQDHSWFFLPMSHLQSALNTYKQTFGSRAVLEKVDGNLPTDEMPLAVEPENNSVIRNPLARRVIS